MKECNNKTSPDAATSELAKTEAKTERSITSTSKFTIPSSPGQAVRVADFLLPGQQNAVPLKQLKELLNLDGRTVRLMIRTERLSGVPILANCRTGYFLPGDERERARCVKSMRHRAWEISQVADALEKSGW